MNTGIHIDQKLPGSRGYRLLSVIRYGCWEPNWVLCKSGICSDLQRPWGLLTCKWIPFHPLVIYLHFHVSSGMSITSVSLSPNLPHLMQTN